MNPIALKCSSGVPGLDDILGGGLPRSCLYLIEGNPGVGKTTVAMQFLLEGRRTRGQPADRERALQAGFDTHLLKPISPELLAQVLCN